MFNDNNRWMSLLIVISLPFGFYHFIKNFRGLPGSAQVINAAKELSDLASPFFNSNPFAKSSPRSPFVKANRVGLTINPIKTANELTFGADKKKTDKKDDKKKTAKKDKKKKPKSDGPAYEDPRNFLAQQQPVQRANLQPVEQSVVNPIQQVATEEQNEELYEYWANLLLPFPHFGNTTDFIGAFQSLQIPSEIYYRLVQEMMNDPRSEMQEFGLKAAGSFANYESFIALANYASNPDSASPVKAREYLENVYSRYEHVDILKMVLSSNGSPDIIAMAASLVRRAAENFVQSGQNPPPGSVSPDSTQVSEFQSLIAILQRWAQDQNNSVSNAAGMSLQYLQEQFPISS